MRFKLIIRVVVVVGCLAIASLLLTNHLERADQATIGFFVVLAVLVAGVVVNEKT